jgi:hypothetical protein
MNALISKSRFAVFFTVLLAFGSATAAPLTWTLNSVTTSDGASWTGTFDYDAATNTYSAINIVTTVSGFPNPINTVSNDSFLTIGCPDPATPNGVTFGFNAAGVTIFCMDFASALTNSAGTVNLNTGDIGWATVGVGYPITGGSVSGGPVPLNVDIDIKPGQVGNWIHPHHNGDGTTPVSTLLDDTIEVGVLGSLTAVGDPIDFATADIDPATVRFGPAAGAFNPSTTPDLAANVDNDGLDDATFDFLTGDVGISCGETEATLTGETTGGLPFEGTDSITTQCNALCH